MAMVADLKWQVPRGRWRSLRHQLGRFVRSSPLGAVSAVILILIGATAIFGRGPGGLTARSSSDTRSHCRLPASIRSEPTSWDGMC